MENKDPDIELLAGQVWNAPERPPLPRWMNQAVIVRRAPLPEESENMHEAPHYRDFLDKKGGA